MMRLLGSSIHFFEMQSPQDLDLHQPRALSDVAPEYHHE